jgi:hypothetical protein
MPDGEGQMDRSEFEKLRDVPGKKITGEIRLSKPKNTAPTMVAEGIHISNTAGATLLLNINYNPVVGSKTLNVVQVGVGPICRLDVDGPPHRPAGRCHKHSLQTPRCPDRNLPDNVSDQPQLSGKTLTELFEGFCKMAQIEFEGTLQAPDEVGTGSQP